MLAVVLLATAIALAGIRARLRALPRPAAVLALGWAVFLGTLAWVATFPVSLWWARGACDAAWFAARPRDATS